MNFIQKRCSILLRMHKHGRCGEIAHSSPCSVRGGRSKGDMHSNSDVICWTTSRIEGPGFLKTGVWCPAQEEKYEIPPPGLEPGSLG